MTFSIRPDGYSTNNENPKLKSFDSHSEPDLISILFLCQNKHQLTKECFKSTIQAASLYEGEIEWNFLVNGIDSEEGQLNAQLFADFECERKNIILKDKNYGITTGLNDLIQISRGELCMIHECDFYNASPDFNFLQVSKDIFHEQPNLDILHLRDMHDKNENWGFQNPRYSPWTCRKEILSDVGIPLAHYKTKNEHEYILSRFPFSYTNNPIIITRDLLRRTGLMKEPVNGSDLRHGESDYQERISDIDPLAGHILKPVYIHAGGTIRRHIESLAQ